jgi:hypothetical protein
MIWDILQKKIEDAGIASVAAGNLFLNTMPGDVTVGVMMKAPLSGVRVDPHIKNYFKPTIQFIVRHTDPLAGDIMAINLMRALTIEGEETYPATAARGKAQLKVFYPRELPICYPRLDGGSIEWSINFVTSFSFDIM